MNKAKYDSLSTAQRKVVDAAGDFYTATWWALDVEWDADRIIYEMLRDSMG
jgi:hypothetical protein